MYRIFPLVFQDTAIFSGMGWCFHSSWIHFAQNRKSDLFKCKLDLLAHPWVASHYVYNTLKITLPPTLPTGLSQLSLCTSWCSTPPSVWTDSPCKHYSQFFSPTLVPTALFHYRSVPQFSFLVCLFHYEFANSFRVRNKFIIVSQEPSTVSSTLVIIIDRWKIDRFIECHLLPNHHSSHFTSFF